MSFKLVKPAPDRKPCSTCQEPKPLDEFDKDKTKPDGRRAQCKTCRRKGRPKQPALTVVVAPAKKTCSGCGVEKDIDQFHKDKSKPDGRHTRCVDCKSRTNRRGKEADQETLKEQRELGEANRRAILRLIDNHQPEFYRLVYSEKVRMGLVEPSTWNAQAHTRDYEDEGLAFALANSEAG